MNSGYVTEKESAIDLDYYSKFIVGKTALVAQGGGQRGIFTSGVLDAFLKSNFDPFDEFYGTSAGALNLCAYVCREPELGKSFILDLTTEPEFFNLFSYIRHRKGLGLEWAFERIMSYPYKLDLDLGRKVLGDRNIYAAVTDTQRLHDHYLPLLGEDWYKVMLATCAIPRLYTDEVEVGGQSYVDGGVSACIPVQEAWRRAARSIVVIRTEPLVDDQDEVNPVTDAPPVEEVEWFKESFNSVQDQWQQRVEQWKLDWSSFFQQQITRSKEHKRDREHLDLLNGGRWLFGADDIYRLSHLVGDKFDSGLADMLMVHFQTYSLTQNFLNNPPDDTFVIQIAPQAPLKASSLMSTKEDLLHDYQQGLEAGYQFIENYIKVKKAR
ncbi:patatin family protein [Vibrio sp. T187]|uniref:patatin-like phospholipase family protein n=1 Tax=Vibrio TaxID=662 RepID=UPI0010C9F116|nr:MULTISPECIES: patatin-like phospholipase family protein [Vibrio]MBW3696562.1 patatin family protein [Vibrio sp. T187]